jgi:hypothetical protein
MDEIVYRRDEIGNTNEVSFVPGQELPSYRYNSLQFVTCRTPDCLLELRDEIEARVPCRSAFKEQIYSCEAIHSARFQIS